MCEWETLEQDLQSEVNIIVTLYVVPKAKRGNAKTRIRLQRIVIEKLNIVNGMCALRWKLTHNGIIYNQHEHT